MAFRTRGDEDQVSHGDCLDGSHGFKFCSLRSIRSVPPPGICAAKNNPSGVFANALRRARRGPLTQ